MKARYKYRIYPNHIQIKKLSQLFGCCRYVWNQSLAYCNLLYTNGQKKPNYVDLTKQFITQAKKELLWLKEVAIHSIAGVPQRLRASLQKLL